MGCDFVCASCYREGSAARVLTATPTASESEEKVVTYDHIGPSVCMGDHKPVFLAFRIAPGAGKPHARVHKCCVVQ